MFTITVKSRAQTNQRHQRGKSFPSEEKHVRKYVGICSMTSPKCSMYGICINICPKSCPIKSPVRFTPSGADEVTNDPCIHYAYIYICTKSLEVMPSIVHICIYYIYIYHDHSHSFTEPSAPLSKRKKMTSEIKWVQKEGISKNWVWTHADLVCLKTLSSQNSLILMPQNQNCNFSGIPYFQPHPNHLNPTFWCY